MNKLKSLAAATGLLCLLSAAHGQGAISTNADRDAAVEGLAIDGRGVQTGKLDVDSANTLTVPGVQLNLNADI